MKQLTYAVLILASGCVADRFVNPNVCDMDHPCSDGRVCSPAGFCVARDAGGMDAGTFDGGTDYLRASDAADLDFGTSSFTVSAFVRPAGATADRLVNKWASTTEPGWLLDINEAVGGTATADRIRMRLRDAAGADVDFSVTAALGTNTWRHVAAVVDLNPRKHGRHVPIGGQEVVAPAALAQLRPRAVVVLNPVYREEIAAMLADLGVDADVVTDPRP